MFLYVIVNVDGVQEESERAAKAVPELGRGERGNLWAWKDSAAVSRRNVLKKVSVQRTNASLGHQAFY
jgi:hypothetical protein